MMNTTLDVIHKTREYLDYLERHINNVHKAWKIVQETCKDTKIVYDDFLFHTINAAVNQHDMSKFSVEEFLAYREKFFPVEGGSVTTYFDQAEKHHKENNFHHWENWTKKKYINPGGWAADCTHMVLDWMAMGMEFGDTAESYYDKNKAKMNFTPDQDHFICMLLARVYPEDFS